MNATVADVIREMEHLAPSRLAEDWDNVGLQVGRGDSDVKNVWVALDPTPDVVAAACRTGVDLLVTHHPLVFKPLKSIDLATPIGQTIARAVRSGMAIFTAHTNLDSAAGGLNDLLARRIGLTDLEVLGGWADRASRGQTLAGIQDGGPVGLGRIGTLPETETLHRWARHIKHLFGLESLRVAGDPDLMVRRVALCTGSGSSLLADFFASDAQVYLSGDLRYHDARAVEEKGRGLVDMGHFASEFLVVEDLARRLSKRLAAAGFDIKVTPCGLEKDPFLPVV